MLTHCIHLVELQKVQEDLIRRDINGYKYLKGIENKELAIQMFIQDTAWMMRQMFCYLCHDVDQCEVAKQFLPKAIKLYDGTDDEDICIYFEKKGIKI